MPFSQLPTEIKGCQHFMKLAEDHDDRNVLVAFYARMAAIQLAMKIIPGSKPPEVSKYLMEVMEWLETAKSEHKDVEGFGNETVAQALIEEYLLKLYDFAYKNDTAQSFHKNMVKAYYTSSLLCEVLTQFGPLSEDLSNKCKTAKYRAAYIHNMLKNGLEPTAINITVVANEEDEEEFALPREELNRRRALRGEEPIPEGPPKMDPAEFEARRKAIEEIRKRGNQEFQDDLRRIKEKIDADDSHNIDDDDDFLPFGPPRSSEPIYPERIIDVGPPIYPEPRLPLKKPETPPDDTNIIAIDPFRDQSHSSSNSPRSDELSPPTSVAVLEAEQTEKAMKYCKWASSALNYDDVKSAIDNLERALYLCRHGKEKA